MAVNLVSCVSEGRRYRAKSSPCHYVVSVVARQRKIASSQILSSMRLGPEIASARQLAMYLSHVLLGMTMTEVGQFFGRDRTTVAHACALVEDSREDPRTDRDIEMLEMRICSRFDPAIAGFMGLGEVNHAAR